jgi:hypothetical protein
MTENMIDLYIIRKCIEEGRREELGVLLCILNTHIKQINADFSIN